MKLKRVWAVLAAGAAICGVAAMSQIGDVAQASDHDDGETDIKSRALNLTDHFAFRSPADVTGNTLSLVMYFNPRSLPGRQYFLSTNARYEFHITKVTAKTDAPAPKDDIVLRFEASAPQSTGDQFITLTVLKNGTVTGTHIGKSTAFEASKAGTIVTNAASIEGQTVTYFVGQRADSFFFDVNRFFQVRAFLAARFFGGAGGKGLPICTTAGQADCATLAPNCEGDAFLQGVLGTDLDGDAVNLFNPPTCAPDFTKNLNVTAIVANVPKALLGGGNVYDTWSTISVLQ
jgi:hypothetical protein